MLNITKRRKGDIYYGCLGGDCPNAMFIKRKQLSPLKKITVEMNGLESEYFVTGDFQDGYVVCLPFELVNDWIKQGEL